MTTYSFCPSEELVKKTVRFIAMVALLTMSSAAPAHPRPEPELDLTYNPTVSFAPLVQALEAAVVAIEVERSVEGVDPDDALANDIPAPFREFFRADPRLFGPQRQQGEGSGFIISEDGLVLTNQHVVAHADTIKARLSDGTAVVATLLGTDARLDIALLQLPNDRTWPVAELGHSAEAQVGDWVLAMGNPLGLGLTVTAGIISGKGRALSQDPYDDFLQTDAAINQGNSGGPLFDLHGRVIGINTAIIQGANTVGFAVPIDTVAAVVDELRESGGVSRGFIGIQPRTVTPELGEAMKLGVDHGALVVVVVDRSPAADAGLLEGDVVIALGDHPISDQNALTRTIGAIKPGEQILLTIIRDGEERHVTVVLGQRPD